MSAGTEQETEERAYVYMVRCAGGQLYTGWTNDPGARLHAHKTGRGPRPHGPWGRSGSPIWNDARTGRRRCAGKRP